MSNQFIGIVNKMDDRDIEEAQTRDFYMWNEYIMYYSQKLYDLLGYYDEEYCKLSIEEIKERKAVLDAAYVYIQSAMEDITTYLQEKYPDEISKKHLELPF